MVSCALCLQDQHGSYDYIVRYSLTLLGHYVVIAKESNNVQGHNKDHTRFPIRKRGTGWQHCEKTLRLNIAYYHLGRSIWQILIAMEYALIVELT